MGIGVSLISRVIICEGVLADLVTVISEKPHEFKDAVIEFLTPED